MLNFTDFNDFYIICSCIINVSKCIINVSKIYNSIDTPTRLKLHSPQKSVAKLNT